MGKLSYEPYIDHFSHPHPLQLTIQSQALTNLSVAICSCCSRRFDGGYLYTCRSCSVCQLQGGRGFALHVACAQMPPLISHPSHPKHQLSLLPAAPYQGSSSFDCDACSHPGSGFCYHCSECGFDLHPTCASKPLTTAHPLHEHQLSLEFFPPYDIRGFTCDVCDGPGKNHWLYRCSSCKFDAHLDCATFAGGMPSGEAPPPQLQQQPKQQPQSYGPALQHYPSYPGSYGINNAAQPPQSQAQHMQHLLQHQASAPATVQNYHHQPQQMPATYGNNMPPAGGPTVAPAQQMYQQQQPPPLAAAGPGGQQGYNSGNKLANMATQSIFGAVSQQVVQSAMGGGVNSGGGDNSGGVDNSGGGDNSGSVDNSGGGDNSGSVDNSGGGDDSSGFTLGSILGFIFAGGDES